MEAMADSSKDCSSQLDGLESKLVSDVQYGRYEEVEAALLGGTSRDLTLKDDNGCTLLHWAAINNRVNIAQLLLDRGARVDIAGGALEETPLQWCCRSKGYGYTYMLDLLIKSGSDVNHANISGHTPLHLCAQGNSLNLAFIILEAGAEVDTRDNEGLSPLLWVLQHRRDTLSEQPTLDMLRLLITYGADMTLKSSRGDNSFHMLARVDRYAFDYSTAFLMLDTQHKCASSTDVALIENSEKCTVIDLASARKSPLESSLFDFSLYKRIPRWVVTMNWGLLIWTLFISLRLFNWWGIVPWFGLLFAHLKTSQTTIIPLNSRVSYGCAWGVIATLFTNFCIYSSSHLHIYFTYTACFLAVAVTFTLLMTRMTTPAHLSKQRPYTSESRALSQRIIIHGIPDGFQSAKMPYNGRNYDGGYDGTQKSTSHSDGTATDIGGVPPRLCPTCIVDRSVASLHCSKCNICVVGLDHHCPFVGSCVGRGNRRVFVLFTFFASLGCLYSGSVLLYTQYSGVLPSCVDIVIHHGEVSDIVSLLKLNLCVFQNEPALSIGTLMGFIVGFWILALLFTQLHMIATETTTHALILNDNQRIQARKNNHGKLILRGPTGHWKGLLASLRNILNFAKSGKFLVTYDEIYPVDNTSQKKRDSGEATIGHANV